MGAAIHRRERCRGDMRGTPYVMIGGGFGLGLLVLAIAMFLKHAAVAL